MKKRKVKNDFAKLYRLAIDETDKGHYACIAISSLNVDNGGKHDCAVQTAFSRLFKPNWALYSWAFEDTSETSEDIRYKPYARLGKMTRALALELAALLAETGEL